jgi:hypothetical protein
MTDWLDLLERPLSVDDYVVLFNNVYQIREFLGHVYNGNGLVRIILVDKSKTTKSVKKNSKDMCKIDKEDVLIWKIKRGY